AAGGSPMTVLDANPAAHGATELAPGAAELAPDAAELAPDAAPRGLQRGLLATALAGAAVFLLGLYLEPERAWGGYLVAFCTFTGLSLAGPLFLAILYLTG